MTESEKMLLALLGIGGIFLVSKSSAKTVAKVKKDRAKAVEEGEKPITAKRDHPTPKEKTERAYLLHNLLEEARKRYLSIEQHIRDHQDQVSRFGLPQELWQDVLGIRTLLVELAKRGEIHFSQTLNSGEDFVFWQVWRSIWRGILAIADRQYEQYTRNNVGTFADPTHVGDPVGIEKDVDMEQEQFNQLPEGVTLPALSEGEYRSWTQEVFLQSPDMSAMIRRTLRVGRDMGNEPPPPDQTTDRNLSSFNALPVTDEREDGLYDRLNADLQGGNQSSGLYPARPGRGRRSRSQSPSGDPRSPRRERDFLDLTGEGETPGQTVAIPGHTTAGGAKPALPPASSIPPGFGKVRPAKRKPQLLGAPDSFLALPPSASPPDKPPAPKPPKRTAPANLPEGTVNEDIRAGFNTTGQVIDNTKPQNASQYIEEQREGGDATARDMPANQAENAKEKAAAVQKFRRQVDGLYHRLERLITRSYYEFGVPKKEKAVGLKLFGQLRDLVPDGVSPKTLYKSCFYQYSEEAAKNVGGMIKLSERQAAGVKASQSYKHWETPMSKIKNRFWKWYGGEISRGKRPENPNPARNPQSTKRRPRRKKDDR